MDLEDFKNKYKGERIFLIGNGPSLKNTPLEKLGDEYTLAMNRIDKIYSDTDWRPSFYYLAQSPTLSTSPNLSKQGNYLEKHLSLNIPCFVNSEYKNLVKDRDNLFFYDILRLFGIKVWDSASKEEIENMPIEQLEKFWSDDVTHHTCNYHSMYGAIQVAVYMGFKEIYLVGCDLGMKYKNPHLIFESGLDPIKYSGTKKSYLLDLLNPKIFFQSCINTVAYLTCKNLNSSLIKEFIGGQDQSHFTDDYFDALEINEGDKASKDIEKSHVASKRICKKRGIEIINVTEGGELEVYPREEFTEILD